MVDTQESKSLDAQKGGDLNDKFNKYLAYKHRWESEAIDFPDIAKFMNENELLSLAEEQAKQLTQTQQALDVAVKALEDVVALLNQPGCCYDYENIQVIEAALASIKE